MDRKKYYIDNLQKIKINSLNYYHQNKEKIKARQNAYYKEVYYKENLDKFKIKNSNYYKKNKFIGNFNDRNIEINKNIIVTF